VHVTGFAVYLALASSGFWLVLCRRWAAGSLLMSVGFAVLLFTPTGS
jgi:hypothetical protein